MKKEEIQNRIEQISLDGATGGCNFSQIEIESEKLADEIIKSLNTDKVIKCYSAEKLSNDGVFFECSKCEFKPLMCSKTDDLINMNYCPNCGSNFNKK